MNRYSTFWRRFVASIVDGFVFMPVSLASMWIFSSAHVDVYVQTIWAVISSAIFPAYSILLHGRYGQTLGKMVMKVRVIDVSETRAINYRQALLRDIVPLLMMLAMMPHEVRLLLTGKSYHTNPGTMPDLYSMIFIYASMGWFILEMLSMLLNKKRRAVHDFIAGTVVVRTETMSTQPDTSSIPAQNAKIKPSTIAAMVAVLTIAFFVTLGFYIHGKVADIMKSLGIEKPVILDHPGIIHGGDVIERGVLYTDSRLGPITDLKVARFFDHPDDLFAVVSTRKAVFFNNEKQIHRTISYSGHPERIRTTIPGGVEKLYFANDGSWGVAPSLMDADGRMLWVHKVNHAVNSMSSADLDGDGKLDFIIGHNGSGGLTRLDEAGELVWTQSGANIWKTAIVDIENNGVMRIVHSDAGGKLYIRDESGKILKTLSPGMYISQFAITRWPDRDGLPHVITAENNVLKVMNFNGKVSQTLQAPDISSFGKLYCTPLQLRADKRGFATIQHLEQWQMSVLFIHDQTGNMIYQEVLAEPCQAIATMRSEDRDVLLVGGDGKLYTYVHR
ncbi:MAG TPA: RDD family protein [Kiritimatiellia bacterium]|mgnify:CR=1 FL=1|nr:RDD family protein [Kiritimatiellia bacterium]